MKVGKSLVELATEIERQKQSKRDFVVPAKQLSVESNGQTSMIISGEKFPVGNIAHEQLSSKLEIPKKYYDKMREKAPKLLDANLNHWLQSDHFDDKGNVVPNKAFMVRTLDGSARAFVSDKFNRDLDYCYFAEALLPVLTELDLMIVSCDITERKIYIKAVSKDIEKDIPTGAKMGNGHTIFNTLVPAITCGNSEVGFGTMFVNTSVITRQCTNLATFADRSMRKYHVGSRHDSSEIAYELFSDKTKNLTTAATFSQLKDVVKAAFDRAKFDALCEKIAGTAEQKIEGDIPKVIELTAKQFNMNDKEQNSILKYLIQGGDLTRYGLSSAVTRTAEDLADYDRASEFEKFGGQIIELPKTDWEKIALAA